MHYSEPHLTYERQLALLKSRGVTCDDDAAGLRFLQANGYYNVTGYVYPFRLPDPSGVGRLDQVQPGTRLEDVARLLAFDRDLRVLLLKGIQIVEVSVRANIAYGLGARDPVGHTTTTNLDPAATSRMQTRHGRTRSAFDWWIEEYGRLQDRARTEPYVAHNLAKYGPPLPIWIACEFLDFGAVTRLFTFLMHADRQRIAATAGLPRERTLRSCLTTMNYVRNACAHNARLWNRVLIQKVQLRQSDLPTELAYLAGGPGDKLYPVIALTAWLTTHFNPSAGWAYDMAGLLAAFPSIPGRSIQEMSAPLAWQGSAPWR